MGTLRLDTYDAEAALELRGLPASEQRRLARLLAQRAIAVVKPPNGDQLQSWLDAGTDAGRQRLQEESDQLDEAYLSLTDVRESGSVDDATFDRAYRRYLLAACVAAASDPDPAIALLESFVEALPLLTPDDAELMHSIQDLSDQLRGW